jgi:DNA polymerase IV
VRLSAEQARERFAERPPGLLPGIGPKTAARLDEHGIAALERLAATDQADVCSWFGPRPGRHLLRLARFEDDRELEPVREAKSESRETTFAIDIRGTAALLDPLEQLTAELCERLASQGRAGPTVGIKVRLDDFSTHTRARTLAEATNDPVRVGAVAADLLRRFRAPRPVRLLGVRVAGLRRPAVTEVGGSPVAAGEQLELRLEK